MVGLAPGAELPSPDHADTEGNEAGRNARLAQRFICISLCGESVRFFESSRHRKAQMKMRRLPLSSGLWLVRTSLAVAVCCGHCSGAEKDAKDQPSAQSARPREKLLSYEAISNKIKSLSTLPIKGCTSGDLTLQGLARLLNAHLEKAGRIERVIVDPGLDVDVAELLKADSFSPLYRNKGMLDKEDLVKQINSGSLGDLLMNMPGLCNMGMEWYEDRFRVGSDWTQDTSAVGFRNWYKIKAVKATPK